ncbi:MAG: Flagellar biosynthesis protein FlhA [Candidatus Accumulibacter sp. BA-94]|nr:MAG: Flagellar biosynthesis protein FlhA [Candidatus Accumulibacter sp. BA-94]
MLRRIRGIRKKFAQDVGFLVSPVHIRDNLELKPNAYKILLKGVEIGEGEAFPGNLLAIDPGRVAGKVPGTPARDPAFGLPAVWIDPAVREQAQAYGYTVVDPSTVVATHLNHLILSHSAELLGRLETQALLDHLAKEMPKMVEDLVPKALSLGVVQKVLRNLLEEGVSLRDMRTVIETLADGAPRSQDPDTLTVQVRVALGRSIVQELYPGASELQVMVLDPQLERLLQQAVAGAGEAVGIEPGLADTLVREALAAAQRQEEAGLPVVLLVSGTLRSLLSRFLRRNIPQLKVLAHAEVPEHRTIKVTSIIGQRP